VESVATIASVRQPSRVKNGPHVQVLTEAAKFSDIDPWIRTLRAEMQSHRSRLNPACMG